jgi:DUF971 family protein
MAGLDADTPIPVSIVLHQVSRVLELAYGDGRSFRLPFEYLRVYSPSAEVRGHGPGQETLQTGKAEVGIEGVEAVGHYAIQPQFSDGHNSGIYSWDYLHELCVHHDRNWADYLRRLEVAGESRHPETASGPIQAQSISRPRGGGCA